jgi:hypothetical protein
METHSEEARALLNIAGRQITKDVQAEQVAARIQLREAATAARMKLKADTKAAALRITADLKAAIAESDKQIQDQFHQRHLELLDTGKLGQHIAWRKAN